MHVSFPVCFGEERVCQDPSGPIERQVVSMPVPVGKTHCTSDKGLWSPSITQPKWELLRGDSSSRPTGLDQLLRAIPIATSQILHQSPEEADLSHTKPWGVCMFSQGCFSPSPLQSSSPELTVEPKELRS